VLSGTLVSWGDRVKKRFDAAIYLYAPAQERINRLRQREEKRFGPRVKEGGDMHKAHLEFLKWAEQYDEGFMGGRSKAKHEVWMKALDCPIKKIKAVGSAEQILQISKDFISAR